MVRRTLLSINAVAIMALAIVVITLALLWEFLTMFIQQAYEGIEWRVRRWMR